MDSASELIDALGGNAAVATLTGVRSSAVSNWRKHGVFPPRLSIRLKRAAAAKGIEAPDSLFQEVARASEAA